MTLHRAPRHRSLVGLVRALQVLMLLVVLSLSGVARADDLEKGKNAYIAKDFTEAEARFRAMLDPTTGTLKSPELIDEARMFLGATLFALKRSEDADSAWAKILEHNDGYAPDPLTFPTAVLDAFTDTRTRHKDEITARKQREALEATARKQREAEEKKRQAEYLALLTKYASEEHIVDHHSRVIAMAPFGIGQFQNGKPVLGTILLVTESALAIAAGVSFGFALAQEGQAYDVLNNKQYDLTNWQQYNKYIARATTTWYVNLAFAGAYAIEAIAGVIEAQVNYVPQVEIIKKRELPKAWLAPTVSTHPENGSISGGGFSLSGRF